MTTRPSQYPLERITKGAYRHQRSMQISEYLKVHIHMTHIAPNCPLFGRNVPHLVPNPFVPLFSLVVLLGLMNAVSNTTEIVSFPIGCSDIRY